MKIDSSGYDRRTTQESSFAAIRSIGNSPDPALSTLARAGKLATDYSEDLLTPLSDDERETLRLLLRKLARVDEAAR